MTSAPLCRQGRPVAWRRTWSPAQSCGALPGSSFLSAVLLPVDLSSVFARLLTHLLSHSPVFSDPNPSLTSHPSYHGAPPAWTNCASVSPSHTALWCPSGLPYGLANQGAEWGGDRVPLRLLWQGRETGVRNECCVSWWWQAGRQEPIPDGLRPDGE